MVLMHVNTYMNNEQAGSMQTRRSILIVGCSNYV